MKPDRGRIMCNGTLLFNSNGTRSNAAFHRRHIGYVFQDGRLFPHMTVAQNLGLRAADVSLAAQQLCSARAS